MYGKTDTISESIIDKDDQDDKEVTDQGHQGRVRQRPEWFNDYVIYTCRSSQSKAMKPFAHCNKKLILTSSNNTRLVALENDSHVSHVVPGIFGSSPEDET